MCGLDVLLIVRDGEHSNTQIYNSESKVFPTCLVEQIFDAQREDDE